MHRLARFASRAAARWSAVALVLLGLAARSGFAAPVSIELGFTGATGSATFPPDSHGAVGPEHVVVLVNAQYRVFDKRDGALLANSTLQNFWFEAGIADPGLPFDPRVLYDAESGRWLATAVNNRRLPNEILLAISVGADPRDGWVGFAIDSDAADLTSADFPMLGFDADAVYVAAPMYDLEQDADVVGVDVLVVPKQDLLAAAPSLAQATLFENLAPLPLGFVPHPVVDLDGGSLPALLLSGVPGPTGALQITAIDGTPEDPLLAPLLPVPIAALEPPPAAAQPGPKPDLETSPGDTRFSSNPVERNGSLWAVHGVSHQGRAALRLLELDAASHAVLQDQLLGDADLDLYYPSVAVSEAGDVVIAMSGSSETFFAGAYAWVGETAGGVTSFGPLLELRAGVSDYQRLQNGTRNRWGDYSATVVDPLEPRVFWTFQEYVNATDQWGVHVARIRVPEPQGASFALAAVWAIRRGRPRARRGGPANP